MRASLRRTLLVRSSAAAHGSRPFTQFPAPGIRLCPLSSSAPLLFRTTTMSTSAPTLVPFSALLAHLRSLFPSHTDPTSPYAPLLCAVLARLNEPELVVQVVEDLLPRLVEDKRGKGDGSGKGEEKGVVCLVRVREAMYKAWPLTGFPLSISSLSHLSTHLSTTHPSLWSSIQRVESASAPPQSILDRPRIEQDTRRGKEMFEGVYGKVAHKVLAGLEHAHPDMPGAAISLIYGPILSDPRIFSSPLDGSLLALALCFACDLPPQTKGHFHGCLNHGASPPELSAVLSMVMGVMEWAGEKRVRIERMDFLEKGGVEVREFEGRRA